MVKLTMAGRFKEDVLCNLGLYNMLVRQSGLCWKWTIITRSEKIISIRAELNHQAQLIKCY